MNRIAVIALLGLLLSLAAVTGAQNVDPTATATPDGPRTLTVWWPEPLASPDNFEVAAVLEAQTAVFVLRQDNVEVSTRLKKATDVGGIMSTLRTASAVAPGAMPDLTLLRRQDLVNAQRANLIQPLDELLTTPLLDTWSTGAALGQVDERTYGVPYVLDLVHTVYRPDPALDYTSWGFDALLEREQPLLFPAGRTTGMNNVLYLQYLQAGGQPPSSSDLDMRALTSTLQFYERALSAGIVDSVLLNYTTPADYVNLFQEDEFDVAVVDSTTYLRLVQDEPDLKAAPVPTTTGATSTLLNGWIWVLTTTDPDRQALAMRYLNWMNDADRQGEYAAAVSQLPSQRPALERYFRGRIDIEFFDDLIENATLPLIESDGGTLARIMQDAFSGVLMGNNDAEAAVESVVNQLDG